MLSGALNPNHLKAGLKLPGHEEPPAQPAKADDAAPAGATGSILDGKFFATIVNFTDGVRQREAFYLKILKTAMDDETLSELRTNIAGLTGSIEISHFPFCNKNGAIVPETFTVGEYLTECLGFDVKTVESVSIYMRNDALATENNNPRPEGAGNVLDADKLALLKHQVNDTAFKWITGTEAKYVPELEQRDWAVIFDSNALGYGLRIVRARPAPASGEKDEADGTGETSATDAKGRPIGLERARFPAFRLKKRAIWSDSLPNSTIEGVKLELRIPDFILDDRSYVSQFETETEMQSSMAASSFSETDVSAAVSGSYMGFSGGISGGYNETGSKSDGSSDSKTVKRVTIAYNFPRVTVFLDSRSLELTPDCEKALRAIESKEDLKGFQSLYGEFFPRRAQLGGRLFATEDVDTASGATSSSTAEAMKVSAAASLSGWGMSASVSASHSKGSESTKDGAHRESGMTLAWQANGGDTLLCNKPTEWAPTVAYHWNWRITRQDQVGEILAVASKFNGMSWLGDKAKALGIDTDAVPVIATGPLGPVKKKASGTQITLNLAGSTKGRYMIYYPAHANNIGRVVEVLRITNNSNLSMGPNLYSRGLVRIGTDPAETDENRRLLQVEDKDGNRVSDIKYGVRYRVRSPATKSYLDYTHHQGTRIVFNNPNRPGSYFVIFEHPDGSHDSDSISEGGQLVIKFSQKIDSEKFGYMFVIAEGIRYKYLAVHDDGGPRSEAAKFTLSFK